MHAEGQIPCNRKISKPLEAMDENPSRRPGRLALGPILTPSFSFSISTFFNATFWPVLRCLALNTSLQAKKGRQGSSAAIPQGPAPPPERRATGRRGRRGGAGDPGTRPLRHPVSPPASLPDQASVRETPLPPEALSAALPAPTSARRAPSAGCGAASRAQGQRRASAASGPPRAAPRASRRGP